MERPIDSDRQRDDDNGLTVLGVNRLPRPPVLHSLCLQIRFLPLQLKKQKTDTRVKVKRIKRQRNKLREEEKKNKDKGRETRREADRYTRREATDLPCLQHVLLVLQHLLLLLQLGIDEELRLDECAGLVVQETALVRLLSHSLGGQADKQTNIPADKRTDTQTDTQADKQVTN